MCSGGCQARCFVRVECQRASVSGDQLAPCLLACLHAPHGSIGLPGAFPRCLAGGRPSLGPPCAGNENLPLWDKPVLMRREPGGFGASVWGRAEYRGDPHLSVQETCDLGRSPCFPGTHSPHLDQEKLALQAELLSYSVDLQLPP